MADLSAPAIDQMIDWLDATLDGGADKYVPLWRGCVRATGGHADLMWQDVLPSLFVGQPMDDQSDERRVALDRLADHLRRSGYRRNLISALIGDGDGTREGAEPSAIGSIVSDVVIAFLASGGRLLIEPDGILSDAHDRVAADAETERAASDYLMLACCPRAQPCLRALIETFGTIASNGWVELRGGDVTMEMAFHGWKKALSHLNAIGRDSDDGDDEAWSLYDFAETIIFASEERGPRAAQIMLWLLLNLQLTSQDQGLAPAREDLPLVQSVRARITFEADIALRALEALQSNQSPEAAHA